MSELQSFFHMGGYAMYVWPSFILSLVVLVANVWFSKAQLNRAIRDTARRASVNSQSREREAQQ